MGSAPEKHRMSRVWWTGPAGLLCALPVGFRSGGIQAHRFHPTIGSRARRLLTAPCRRRRGSGHDDDVPSPASQTAATLNRTIRLVHRRLEDQCQRSFFKLDSSEEVQGSGELGHNRWHPEIPPVATVKPGDSFRVDCRESFDGAIGNNDSAEDILDAPLLALHQLSGPIAVQGAKPGDLLIVDILDVGPIPQEDSGPLAGQGWGYTGIFSRNNGGGFLTEQFPDAYKAIWDFKGQVATSRHVPEVSFPGLIHPGLMGTAPSAELLAKWNKREAALIATDPHRVPPLALPAGTPRGGPGQACRSRTSPAWPRRPPAPPAAGERRQPGHQEPVQGDASLLSGLRQRRQPLRGRPALLPG